MDLIKIDELDKLIHKLAGIIKNLASRKTSLENEMPNAKNAPSRLDAAVVAATNRVSALAAFGMRAQFLEDIIQPVRNTPDCSGIGTTVENEISKIQDEIQQANTQIGAADFEKKQLEMEAP